MDFSKKRVRNQSERISHSENNRNLKGSTTGYESILIEKAFQTQPAQLAEPFAETNYEEELNVKHLAFDDYCKSSGIKATPLPILPSPKPRGYRTTTKRRVFFKGKTRLILSEDFNRKVDFSTSHLEPESHTYIYQSLYEKLNSPAFRLAAAHLNHIIIRGSYSEHSVIFNIDEFSGEIIRKFKLLADHLKQLPLKNATVISSFLFLDPSRSEYYFEQKRPESGVAFKLLYGPPFLFLKLNSLKLSYAPTSFSQVNESILPEFISCIESFLPKPKVGERIRLLDLYSGYGLFTHHFSKNYSEVIGIDSSKESIDSAKKNSEFVASQGPVKFYSGRISSQSLKRFLPPFSPSIQECIILDPPRMGVDSGVIDFLASRKPKRVIHIFCGTESIPSEIEQWEKSGYQLKTLQPVDMFAGTLNLEVIAVLDPKNTRSI
ncbi:MAG: hypothetical protein SFU91_02925 [Chloroherpetonaceae bacterium]|nr:hypothetical protein [Chloroherpetonaceae bacterium]